MTTTENVPILTKKYVLKRLAFLICALAIYFWKTVVGWCLIIFTASYFIIGQVNFLPVSGALTVMNLHTKWSESYSSIGFFRISEGNSKQEVLEKAGDPLKKEVGVWDYTYAGPGESFHMRRVNFDENGKVTKKLAYVWESNLHMFPIPIIISKIPKMTLRIWQMFF